MELPLVIGRSSINQEFSTNIIALPHLFISYSDEDHMRQLINSFCNQLVVPNLNFFLAVHKETYTLVETIIPTSKIASLFITNEALEITPISYKIFMDKLIKELNKRSNLLAKFNISNIKELNSLMKSNKNYKSINNIIVVADNIFELVLSKHKKTGINFLKLVVDGPTSGIHLIAAGANSYRNLLKQLIYVHPALKTILDKNNISMSLNSNNALGAELILTGEGLRFFKERHQDDFTKLYP